MFVWRAQRKQVSIFIGKDTFEFVPNGIDVDRFTFDENKRIEMRKMLGIRDEYVIGHVGRFNLQKNHEYLLRIF